MPELMRLIAVSAHQYGPGRTHIAAQHADGSTVAFCTYTPVYGQKVEGSIDDVTCQRCLKSHNRRSV